MELLKTTLLPFHDISTRRNTIGCLRAEYLTVGCIAISQSESVDSKRTNLLILVLFSTYWLRMAHTNEDLLCGDLDYSVAGPHNKIVGARSLAYLMK